MSSNTRAKLLPPLSEISIKRPIRLILSDFDGTFTDHEHTIPKANVEGFRLAAQLGITIGFATGRGMMSTVKGLGEANAASMNYNGSPGVFCNGAYVVGRQGETVAERVIPSSLQKRILDFMKQKGLLRYMIGLTEGDSYCVEYNDSTLLCFDSFGEAKPVLLPNEESMYNCSIYKLMLWQKHEDLTVLRKELEHEFADAVEFTMPYPELLELCQKGSNKGYGLHALTKHLGIHPDEVLVLGDSENDISMFKEAGVAVAVGNAAPEAKNAAMFQTVRSEHGPLLEVLKILQEKGLCPKKEEGQKENSQ